MYIKAIMKGLYIALMTMLLIVSCGQKSGNRAAVGGDASSSTERTEVPAFNGDSALSLVRAQTDMGPRVPGSRAHARCRTWLASRLAASGADTVVVQHGRMADGRGRDVELYNIMGRYGLDKGTRLLLLAHYDTRPWADEDADVSNHDKPIDGANDGGSGVAVLLHIAEAIGRQSPGVGVDILFVDAEDSGITDEGDPSSDDSWCLGSQYFARNLPYAGRLPAGAVLLDMVGGRDAVFRREYFSANGAGQLLERVWKAAADAGHGVRFVNADGGAVNDDHIPLLRAGIPTIDIIETGHPQTGGFNPTWHTMQDNIDNIDAATLQAVGDVVMRFVYTYK